MICLLSRNIYRLSCVLASFVLFALSDEDLCITLLEEFNYARKVASIE